MANRGGRWGGRGGRGGRGGQFDRSGKPKAYILFPEDVVLPVLPNVDAMPQEEKAQIFSKYKLDHFWLGSCYHLEQEPVKSRKRSRTTAERKEKEPEDVEIERYSDRFKKKKKEKREELGSYLKLISSNFPMELVQGSKRALQPSTKKLRWDGNLAAHNLDDLEKREKDEKGQDGKEKKDDEEDLEEEVEEEEDESDGDYAMNKDFDDDEDDWNAEEEPDEDYYD